MSILSEETFVSSAGYTPINLVPISHTLSAEYLIYTVLAIFFMCWVFR